MAGDKTKSAAPELDIPEGLRLRTFRPPYPVVESLTTGFALGDVIERGTLTGTVEFIVARPEGVLVGIRNADKSLGELLFAAAGYGIRKEAARP